MPPTTDENVPLFPSGTISVPEQLEYHAVEDGELERLIKIQRPVFGGAALMALGVLLGVLPEAMNTVDKAIQESLTIGEVLYLIMAPAMLAVVVCAGIIAFVGKSEGVKALEAIRVRPKIPLPRGHPAAPPPHASTGLG